MRHQDSRAPSQALRHWQLCLQQPSMSQFPQEQVDGCLWGMWGGDLVCEGSHVHTCRGGYLNAPSIHVTQSSCFGYHLACPPVCPGPLHSCSFWSYVLGMDLLLEGHQDAAVSDLSPSACCLSVLLLVPLATSSPCSCSDSLLGCHHPQVWEGLDTNVQSPSS